MTKRLKIRFMSLSNLHVTFHREVLRLRGSISRDMPWEVMPDLFFYRDPEEAEKEEAARAEEVKYQKEQ